jgi:hypothetical protein
LFVTRAIGNNEVAMRTVKVAVGYINRNTLLAFRVQTISQQGEVQYITIFVLKTTLAPQRINLIVGKHARVVKQAAQQGALAVIDASTGDETQKTAFRVISRHQK